MNIDEKISKIEPKIKEPSFLENKGLSNEVGYYIFDYNPKYELKVRDEVSRLKNKYASDSNYSFSIVEFDLYEIIIDILKEKGYLEKVFKFEEKKGIKKPFIFVSNSVSKTSHYQKFVTLLMEKGFPLLEFKEVKQSPETPII